MHFVSVHRDPDDTSKAYLYATLCFFGGIVITWIFDQLLHVYERCIAKRSRKKNPKYEDSPIEDSTDTPPIVENPTNPSDVEGQAEPQATPETPRDERMVIDHNIGHDGEMIAAMYENEDQDSKALARMGIFAGIALAFHVRQMPFAFTLRTPDLTRNLASFCFFSLHHRTFQRVLPLLSLSLKTPQLEQALQLPSVSTTSRKEYALQCLSTMPLVPDLRPFSGPHYRV